MPPTTDTHTERPATVERVVVAHRYSWTTPNLNKPGEVLYQYADRGNTITVTEEEAARGEALGALATAESLEQAAAYRRDLELRIAEFNAQAAAHAAVMPPVAVGPPQPSRSGVVLTPAQTGIPQLTPLPADQGPIAPTTPSALDAARALAAERGETIDGFTPTEDHPLPPPLAPTSAGTTADAAARAAAAAAAQPTSADVADDELAGYDVPTTLAWLNQNPDQVDRLDGLEAGRDRGPRKGVTDAIEAIREAQALNG